MDTPPRRRFSWTAAAVIVGVLAVAAGLRVWNWPRRYDVRDVDEVGYLSSSLCLVEGITPGYKPSPAGPLIWLGWAWAEAHVAYDEIRPYPAARAVPVEVRVFLAADQAVAGLYHDLSGMRQFLVAVNVVLAVVGCLAGAAYGWRAGGVAGAVVVGGVLAACPLFVDYADQSRPYAMAWSFAAMATAAAAARSDSPARRRVWFWSAAVLMGLSVGSRVEMLTFLPVLWWVRARWSPHERWPAVVGDLIGLTAVATLTTYVVAPWLLTGLPGNLRAIATVQVVNPSAGGDGGPRAILRELTYTIGLGPLLAAFLMGAAAFLFRDLGGRASIADMVTSQTYAASFLFREAGKRWEFALIVIVLGLTATVFKSTGFGLHHKGPSLLAVVFGTATVAGAVARRRPVAAGVAAGLVVAMPLVMSLVTLRQTAGRPAAAEADWVAAHVPAGATVYTHLPLFKASLPTAAAADRIWGEVTALDSGPRKFASGLKRFKLSADVSPRLLSDENLVQERGNDRRYYILGDDAGQVGPRYDLRLLHPSPVFGVQDAVSALAQTGGVVLWRTSLDGDPPAAWGSPAATVPALDGEPVLVFCSSEFRAAVAAP